MASEIPPTDYFNGISFNPDFYQSSSSEYLTTSTGRNYFLTYPITQGSEIFTKNITLQSTLTDSLSSVGTSGQLLSSTATGTKWITSASGTTYISYSASATLSLSVNPILLVIFSGSTAGQTLTIPFEYPVGQKIQIKSTATVNVSISSGSVATFLYGVSASTTSITLMPSDVINLVYSGSSWVQYAPSNTFTKIVGANGCIAGQTNYVSINTSTLPQTLSTVINTDLFVFLAGSTASKTLNIPTISNTGQTITIKNTSSFSVNIAFPTSNIMLFYDNTVLVPLMVLKPKEVLSMYWASAFWVQTTPSNTMTELISKGDITAMADLNLSVNLNLASSGLIKLNTDAGTVGQYLTSQGPTIMPNWTSPAWIGTATSGLNMNSNAITAASGITSSTGNITASIGNFIATIGKLIAGTIDAVADTAEGTTALKIGNNVITGTIEIGNAQTTGDIKIGLSDIAGATITVGTASTATTINGTLTANNGLTLASSKYITTSHTGTITAPTATQVGGIVVGAIISSSIPLSNNVTSLASIVLSQGSWVVTACKVLDSTGSTSRVIFGFGVSLKTNDASSAADYSLGIMTGQLLGATPSYNCLTANISLTTSTSTTVYLNIVPTYTTTNNPSSGATIFLMNAIRIA